MEQLIQGAVAGSWPAAFAIAAISISAAAAVFALFWGMSRIAAASR